MSYGANNNNLDEAITKLQQGHFKEAFSQFKRLAATNNVTAQYYVAQCYEHGIGIEVNKSEAFSMYRRAAKRGFAPAMYDLAKCYRIGIGVAQNNERAAEWDKRYTAKQNNYDIVDFIAIFRSTPEASPLLAENHSSQSTIVGSQPTKVTQSKVETRLLKEPVILQFQIKIKIEKYRIKDTKRIYSSNRRIYSRHIHLLCFSRLI